MIQINYYDPSVTSSFMGSNAESFFKIDNRHYGTTKISNALHIIWRLWHPGNVLHLDNTFHHGNINSKLLFSQLKNYQLFFHMILLKGKKSCEQQMFASRLGDFPGKEGRGIHAW